MLRVGIVISVVSMLLSTFSIAQLSRIAGTVRDSDSQEPLSGVNILLTGTSIGTATNDNGHFAIATPDSGTYPIRFSMIGYAAIETTIILRLDDSLWIGIGMDPEHIEEEVVVITGTRTLRSIADVPVRVEAIPEEEVEEKLLMTPSNVAMLLNESTGMRVQTTSAASSTANLRIQGMSGRYTQILNDGIPSLGGLSSGLSLTQLVPLDLRQVEVLKGATSSLYGADAIAGVVNFIPKLPGKIPETSLLLNGTTQNGVDIAGFYSGRFAETGVSILASHNRQPRYDVDGDGFADVAAYERSTITPKVLHQFSDNLTARFGLSMLEEHRIGGAMKEAVLPLTGYPPYTERINTNRFDATSHLDWQPTSGQALSVKLAWLNAKRDAEFGNTPFRATQNVYFADAQYSFDLPEHNLLVGSAFRLDDVRDRTPNLSASRSFRLAVQSLFMQDEIRASEVLTLLISGRLDVHNEYGTFVVPRLSVMYRPIPSLTLRIGGGTGYKAPTIFVEEAEEVGFRNVRPLTNALPEKAKSASMDLNWRGILGSFTVECNSALFMTYLDDEMRADEDSLQADVVYFRNSAGTTKSIGGEYSLRLTYAEFKLSIGYTYLYATEETPAITSEIALNPRHSLGIVAMFENHEEQLKMGLENYWTGSQHVERNPFRTLTPPYWITGFIAEKGFGNVRLFVNLENIFDTRQTKYEPLFVGNLVTGSTQTLPVYAPLEGRVINGGIRYVLR